MPRTSRQGDFTEINITPLTDIFLVLLIIMMVLAPLLDSQGIKLVTPTVGPDTEITEEPKVLTLHVTETGYFINEDAIAGRDLQQTMFKLKSDYPEGLVIETDAEALHGTMVKALDAARGAGIDKIAVIRAEDAGGEASPE